MNKRNFDRLLEYALYFKDKSDPKSISNLKKTEELVIKSGNPYFAYDYAKKIDGADVKALGQVVIDSGSFEMAHYFARDVKGADVLALQKVVMDSKIPYYCAEFKKVKGADVEALEKVLSEIEKRNNKKPEKSEEDFEEFIKGLE